MSFHQIISRFCQKRPNSREIRGSYSAIDSIVTVDVKPFLSEGENPIRFASPGPVPTPKDIYNGGFPDAPQQGIRLRISNGGAGQAGLIKAWADAFIQYQVAKGAKPFEIAWYLMDTTGSLAMLASGTVDIALTYNPAAEKQMMNCGAAIERIYAFRDHFMLVGPRSNPADIRDDDDILTMFNKIVASGNCDVLNPPDHTVRPPTRFLSRFDKSATNIKESQLFATIGQVPWALDYSKWYHQYPRFPQEALEAASLLSEYTLTDYGTWLSASKSTRTTLKVFKIGSDEANDPLLNPGHMLRGSRTSDISRTFLEWVASSHGGQKVVEMFSKNDIVLYTKAPVKGDKVQISDPS